MIPLLSFLGDAGQDRPGRPARVPITAKVVADFLSSVGVDRVLTVGLHAGQVKGFFGGAVDKGVGSRTGVVGWAGRNV
ncbi:hypothetical protein ACLBVW_37315, partial [Pseudomonas aeruginosa]